MTETANLGLPFIDGSQAQKHVTHNEALRILDDAIQIAVLDSTLTAPPSSPVDGERHIVANGATGVWAGQGDAVATWETNAWRFLVPKAGWCVWSVADDALLVFDGGAWTPVTTGASALDNVPSMGINATVAESNLLTVRSNDALLNAIETVDGGTGDVRLQLSKEAAGNTSSVVFSDAFSGRAEFGLTGDDDFHLKVSADGTSWRDALKFDRTSGRVSFPSGGAREMLSADRAYYVRTDGSDSNDGLANTSGGALRTIPKAISAAFNLDLNGFNVTIQVGAGTYTEAIVIASAQVGAGGIKLKGDTTTPSNVVIATVNATNITVSGGGTKLGIEGFKFTNSGGSSIAQVYANGGALISITGKCEFGTADFYHIISESNATVSIAGISYTISGGGQAHWLATTAGVIISSGCAWTLSGTPAFTQAFSYARTGALISTAGNTVGSGSATGPRYLSDNNSVINTFGSGANYFPGNAAGSTTSGGQYA